MRRSKRAESSSTAFASAAAFPGDNRRATVSTNSLLMPWVARLRRLPRSAPPAAPAATPATPPTNPARLSIKAPNVAPSGPCGAGSQTHTASSSSMTPRPTKHPQRGCASELAGPCSSDECAVRMGVAATPVHQRRQRHLPLSVYALLFRCCPPCKPGQTWAPRQSAAFPCPTNGQVRAMLPRRRELAFSAIAVR